MQLVFVVFSTLCVLRGAEADAKSLEALHKRIQNLHNRVNALIRQTELQYLALYENGRSEGDSGLKTVSVEYDGTKPYLKSSLLHSRNYPGSIATNPYQADRITSTSMQVSLNGVDFKYGGQWFYAKQPSMNSKAYMAVQDIAMPPVPPAVLKQNAVWKQKNELLEWFRAFRDNNYATRDFRPYFKPIVCYLEGWWEKIGEGNFMYSALYGYKENMYQAISGLRRSYWPRSSEPRVIWTSKNGIPTYAQWKHRVLCQPIKTPYFKRNRFIPVDDLSVRMMMDKKFSDYKNSNFARFTINPSDTDNFYDRSYRIGLLDKVMANVPGLDNHMGNLRDTAFDTPVYNFDNQNQPLNTAFYHRFYKVKKAGAMGQLVRHRGYGDSSIFMAQTSQDKVAEQSVEDCKYVNKKQVCKTYVQKFTYAVPLLVTYLTPLSLWNPFNLPSLTEDDQKADGRNGDSAVNKAYKGYSKKMCTTIPYDFFDKNSWEWSRHVLVNGTPTKVGGCGFRLSVTPKGLGRMRMTYPLNPTYHEGSSVMKEVAALQDLVLDEARYKSLWR